mgnify:FL=1
MARSQSEDFLQNFRFHVRVIGTAGGIEDPIKAIRSGTAGVDNEAGFQQVTVPEISTDANEYREGTMKWTRKLPGAPTVGDATLMRGVVKQDSKFFDWMIQTATGGDYRVDLAIFQFARGDVDPGVDEAIPAVATKVYILRDAFPTRAKPTGDMDATNGEVSMAEIDIACEKIEVESNITI